MPIVVNLYVMIAKRKITQNELCEKMDLTLVVIMGICHFCFFE